MVLARGQQGSKLFDGFSAMFFHEYFADFDGDFGVFDENDTYNFVPNKCPHFSFFFKRPGRLKGRIRYFEKATKNSDAIFVNQNILFLHISKII